MKLSGKLPLFAAGAAAGMGLFVMLQKWVWERPVPQRVDHSLLRDAGPGEPGKNLRELLAELDACRRDRENLVQSVSGCIDYSNETQDGLSRELGRANALLDRFRQPAGTGLGQPLEQLARGLVSIIIQHDRNERVSRCTGYLVRRGDDVRLFTAGHCVDNLRGEAWVHLVRYRFNAPSALLMPDLSVPPVSFEHTVCRRDGSENPQGALAGRSGTVDLADYELVRAGRPSRCLEISATRNAPPGSGREPPGTVAAALLDAARPESVKPPADFDQVYFVAHYCQRPNSNEEQCVGTADGWAYLPVVATVIGRTGEGVPFFVLNQRARPGDSGGPIVGLDGSLMGLVSATHLGKSITLFSPVAAVWK